MSAALHRAARGIAWPLLGVAVTVHAALGALAAAEYAWLVWLPQIRFDLAAVTLMVATAVAGLAAAGQMTVRAAAGSARLRRLAREHRTPLPAAVRSAAAQLGLEGRIQAVAAAEPFAVTFGLLRPRILVGDRLATDLRPAELTAVLAHERCHLLHRDPARLLAARLLAAYGWYLPAARWLAARVAMNRELAADRAALIRADRRVLAAALLKLAALPACAPLAAAGPARDPAGSLEARIAQLEHGRQPSPRPPARRVLASAGGLVILAAAGVCCVGLSQALLAGVL